MARGGPGVADRGPSRGGRGGGGGVLRRSGRGLGGTVAPPPPLRRRPAIAPALEATATGFRPRNRIFGHGLVGRGRGQDTRTIGQVRGHNEGRKGQTAAGGAARRIPGARHAAARPLQRHARRGLTMCVASNRPRCPLRPHKTLKPGVGGRGGGRWEGAGARGQVGCEGAGGMRGRGAGWGGWGGRGRAWVGGQDPGRQSRKGTSKNSRVAHWL